MQKSGLRYAIVGSGALGGFYGGMLAKAGCEVHFLFNSDYSFVRENGLRIDSVTGDFHLATVNAYRSTRDMPVCDVVLVCLKTTSNHLLQELLPPLLHQDTVVVLVQNGFGIEKTLSVSFPDTSVAGGLGFICSGKKGPGHIDHQDFGKLTLGWHQGGNPQVLDWIVNDLKNAGVPAEKSPDLLLSRWKKLVWNIPYNGLCVVMNTTTECLMHQADTRELIEALMIEVVEASGACGAPVNRGFVAEMLESTDRMKPYSPSMKLDFDYKRPLEIDAIYSATIREAATAGFEMPKVKMLEQQLRFIQDSYF